MGLVTDVLSIATLGTVVCVRLLWRIIRIQKATIQALTLHIKTLTAYIETVTGIKKHAVQKQTTNEVTPKAPSLKSSSSDISKVPPLNKDNIHRPSHKKAS